MLIAKNNPKGIDIPIQDLQRLLYNRVCAKWNFDPAGNKWQCYGRAYRNQTEDGYVPEVYIGGNEYRDVYYDDGYPVISFFHVDDRRQFEPGFRVEVALIFALDISKVHAEIGHRADEEIHVDVVSEIETPRFGFEIAGIQTGIDNVYREYSQYMESATGIKYRDMHPLHCFRVNMNLIYSNKNC